MAAKPESYLIIGSGVFGASTAFHLQLAKPTASITLIDRTPFPNPSATSHDLNKIVRADYDDIFYMKLALEAVEHWRTNPIFKDYYHESGIALLENVNMGRGALENYRTLGVDIKAEILSVEDARGRFGGVYEEAEWEGAKECYWNPGSGWGEGEGALRSLIEAAVEAGVFYVEATVERLSIDSNGICTGVSMTDGEVMSADHVILCTGARTAQLLADTAPGDKDLQVGGGIIAAGACSAIATFAPEMMERYRAAPVFINGLDHTYGGSFHAWKFMPVLGKYAVQLLDGTLDAEKMKRWAWDREDEGTACVMYIPTRDLKGVEGYD